MPFSKPAQWGWTALGCARPDLAAGLGLWLPNWEGTGSPREYIGNTTLTRHGGCTWATQEGMPVLRFDGTGYMLPVVPVIGTSRVYTQMVVLRSALPAPSGVTADMAIYEEIMDGGTGSPANTDPTAGYTEPLYLSQTDGNGPSAVFIGSDHYGVATDPQELFTATDVTSDLSSLAVIISRRNGIDMRLWYNGTEISQQPPDPDDNIIVPATKAVIGITSDDGSTYVRAGLVGDMATLAVWPTTAKSDQAIADLSTNPFAFAAQAPVSGGVGGRPRLAVLCG